MDFENEEIFGEISINNEGVTVESEKEQLQAIIEEATKRLKELNESDNSNGVYSVNAKEVQQVEYSDDELMDTILIKDATERLRGFDNKIVYTNPEDLAEISELASTIASATNRLSQNCTGFVPYNEDVEA